MKKSVFALLACLAFFAAPFAFAGTIPEYTAEIVDTENGRVQEKIAVTSNSVCRELFDEQGARFGIACSMAGWEKMYLTHELIYEENGFVNELYAEIPCGKGCSSFTDMLFEMEGQREKVGTENVNGYQSDKFLVTAQSRIQGLGEITRFEWIAPEFSPMPIRTQMIVSASETSQFEMRNITPKPSGAAPADLPEYARNIQFEQWVKNTQGAE